MTHYPEALFISFFFGGLPDFDAMVWAGDFTNGVLNYADDD
jgi:hypothetical protein